VTGLVIRAEAQSPYDPGVVVNLFGGDWDQEREAGSYALRRLGVGRRLGGELLGAGLFEVPPGKTSGPYHYHWGNEELLLVLEGSPTLRTPEGERELSPGDVALFRRGPEGSHQVINRSAEPARFLMVSTMVHPDVGEYPDSGKVGVFGGAPPMIGEDAPLELFVPRDAAVDYFEGEEGLG
jgi:uncharacterized cupin superfamily protein